MGRTGWSSYESFLKTEEEDEGGVFIEIASNHGVLPSAYVKYYEESNVSAVPLTSPLALLRILIVQPAIPT